MLDNQPENLQEISAEAQHLKALVGEIKESKRKETFSLLADRKNTLKNKLIILAESADQLKSDLDLAIKEKIAADK